MTAPDWFAARLSALAALPSPSMLEIGCGDGARLAQAQAAGVQPFGVETGQPARRAARQRCPGAYVAATVEEIPPHRFDLILLSGSVGGASARDILYELAAKGAFDPATVVLATADPDADLAKTLADLRFSATAVETADGQCRYEAQGSDFSQFMQERYVPGTWSEIAAYEHLPRYAYACSMAEGARVLDFGCGSGYGTASLAGQALSVTGLDISEDALAYARARHAQPNIAFVRDDALGASLPDASFDLIVCFEVIEHLAPADQDRLPPALARLLAPGGRLLVSTPNPQVTALYGANPYHLRELTEAEFAALLETHFGHVALVEQSIHASVFFAPGPGSRDAGDQRFQQRDVEGLAGPTMPASFLAVCSAEPMPPQPSLVFPDRARDYVSARIRALGLRNQQLLERYALVCLRAQIAQMEALRREDRAALDLINADRHRVEAELAAVTSELEAVLADRALLQRTYSAERAERDRLAASLAQAHTDIETHRTAAEQAQTTVAQLEREHAAALAQSQATLAETVTSLAASQAELAARTGELAARTEELAATKEELAARTGELAARRDELAATTGELAARTEELAATKEELAARTGDLAARTDELAQARAAAHAESTALQAALAAAIADAAQKEHHLALTTLRLHDIETSTSWRVIRRMAPLLRTARPVVRPVGRVGWRLARRVFVRPAPVAAAEPEPQPEPLPLPPPPRNLALETSLDPVWDEGRRAYALQPDPSWQPLPPTGTIDPYVVRPVHAIDPAVARPKILHVIPNVHVGGSTQLIIDLVQHLSASFDHEVLTSSLWPGGAHRGLTVHHVPTPAPAEMADLIGRLRPDLVHMHYWGLTDDPWYHAALDAMKAHPAPALQNINTPVAPLVDDAFQHYVFVSQYVRHTFGERVPPTRSSVIYPGIDLSLFGTANPSADRDDAIGMVYRLEDDKLNENAIDLFIEVARRRPRTKIYIVGGGRFLLPYLEKTEAAGVRANFRFTGYVPYATLPNWYDRFAIFVAPVWKESFGQVVPFAMRKRAAVAGYAVGALPEILGSGETLGISVAETAAIITDLLDDPDRLHELGARNEARATELFAIEDMVGRYKGLYRALLASRVELQRR